MVSPWLVGLMKGVGYRVWGSKSGYGGQGTPYPIPHTPYPNYIELRTHTAFSFGDGAISPEALARRACALGYTHVGITDTADLGALAKFMAEATAPTKNPDCENVKEHGSGSCPSCQRLVRLIAGAELNVDGRPAAFIARTPEGYCNLAALVTLARVGVWSSWEKGAQKKRRGTPGVTWEQVTSHSDGLHALTGPASSPLASHIIAGNNAAAHALLKNWRDVFDDRLSVEVQLHCTGGDESALASELITLAERKKIPWVVTQNPRYTDGGGRLVHDLLTALRYDLNVDEAHRRGLLRPNGDWRLRSPQEMSRRWQGRTQGLKESCRIAEECGGFTLDWMRPPLPDFGRARGRISDDDVRLRQLVEDGARDRWKREPTIKEMEQLNHELNLIRKLGFAGFFLVMADAIRFARERKILCQGRGSAANSAVAYCLGITAIDPIENGLLFERFLSDARVGGKAVEPPDIDVDFEHERREEVLDYMYEHYDRKHAAITAVTQMYRAPNAVQDAMRAFGYPPELAFKVSKRVHRADPAQGAALIKEEVAGRVGLDISTPRGQALLTAIAAFEGLARLRSTHVGGFVLSAAPLGNYLPVEQTTMGRTIIQFDKDDLDIICVPKFDFLGLGALAMVRRAFDAIELRTGERPEMYSLPIDDKATYELIQRGETIGTFQIESRAQTASILHTRPQLLYDIVVQVALVRPGPIQAKFVHPYTQRRLGLEEVKSIHPALDPILKRTYGIPIFQEQAMAISMALGGYSGAEADAMRRTMGNIRKKGRLEAALVDLRKAMLERSARGEIDTITESVADQLCADLLSFANYGFPESHAWSFALIAYATAWLKVHHPTEFYLGLINAQPMGFYPVSTLIHDARRHGVNVRPPCLADGNWECTTERTSDPERPALRIGWSCIRGVGSKTIEALRAARETAPFTSISDVVRRTNLDRGNALSLARAGAFAKWTPDRRHAAWEALRATGDVLPFAPGAETLHHPAEMNQDRLILLDYFAVGLSLNGHPMGSVRKRLVRGGVVDSRDLDELPNGRMVTVGGLVTVRQRPPTAGGTIFLLLEDEHGFINVIVPNQLVADNEDAVKRALFILVRGKLEKDGAVINVVGKQFRELAVGKVLHRSRDFH